MNIQPLTKMCSKCKIEKDLHYFKYDNRYLDKISKTCIECQGGHISTEEKKCKLCGEIKFLHQFRKNNNKGRIGFSNNCCICDAKEEKQKYWNTDLRDKSIAKCKRLRQENYEQDIERCRTYKKENPEVLSIYAERTKDIKSKKSKEYYAKPENKKKKNNYKKHKLDTDEQFRITECLRSRLRIAFFESDLKKEKPSKKYGIFWKEIAIYLDEIKPDGEKLSIDHIIPCKSFDLTNDEHVKLCFSKENLRWCSLEENSAKSNYIIPDLIRKYNLQWLAEYLDINLTQHEHNNKRLDKYNKQEE